MLELTKRQYDIIMKGAEEYKSKNSIVKNQELKIRVEEIAGELLITPVERSPVAIMIEKKEI